MRSRRRLMQTLLTATRNDQLHYLSKSVLLEAVDTYFKLDHLARIKTIETISSELDVDFNFGQCALAARQTMVNPVRRTLKFRIASSRISIFQNISRTQSELLKLFSIPHTIDCFLPWYTLDPEELLYF